MSYGFNIMVEGDYACFTRPELKVERVSYDVPTPSALEGLIKGVYWKPAIRYVIDKIVVYHPISFINVRRNEVKSKVSMANMRSQMNKTGRDPTIYTKEDISQRASILLRDVKYGISFHFEMTGLQSSHADESPEKHYNILKRRLENGQCFRHPCLGCSEFPVRKIELVEQLPAAPQAPAGEVDLGYMLYGMRFTDGGKPTNGDWENPKFSDRATAAYYRPRMVNGVIDVAAYRDTIRG